MPHTPDCPFPMPVVDNIVCYGWACASEHPACTCGAPIPDGVKIKSST